MDTLGGLGEPFRIFPAWNFPDDLMIDLASEQIASWLEGIVALQLPLDRQRQLLTEDAFLRKALLFEVANYVISEEHIRLCDARLAVYKKYRQEKSEPKYRFKQDTEEAIERLERLGVCDTMMRNSLICQMRDISKAADEYESLQRKNLMPIYSGGQRLNIEIRAKPKTLPLYWSLYRLRSLLTGCFGGDRKVRELIFHLSKEMNDAAASNDPSSMARQLSNRTLDLSKAEKKFRGDYRSILTVLKSHPASDTITNLRTFLGTE